jgi:hypothetical protein
MGLFSKKSNMPAESAQTRALAALEANTVKLPAMALNNEAYSVAGDYEGNPKKAHLDAMSRFLASQKTRAVYPEVAWSGAVFLVPQPDGTVAINADGVTIDQLSKKGAEAYLSATDQPVPVWCDIQLIGKAPYTRMHVSLRTKKPKA